MRRIFIIWPVGFPHIGAPSNYVENLSKALVFAGYEVNLFIFVRENIGGKTYPFEITDISLHSNNGMVKRLGEGRLLPFRCIKKLLKLKLNQEDLIITRQESYLDGFLLILKKMFKFKTCTCPLEWFTRDFFTSYFRWQEAQHAFIRNGKHDLILPISRNIEKAFDGETPKKFILPPITEIDVPSNRPSLLSDHINFIFSASGRMKDSIDDMLKGIELLDDESLSKSMLHFTGIKKEYAATVISSDRWDTVEKHLVFHQWMSYEELIALYTQCRYLYLARKSSRATISNFPSKIPETMAMGIVPVVSDVGDYAELYLKDGIDSIFIEGNEASACANALKKAINLETDQYVEMSKHAIELAREKFSYEKWSKPLSEAIESLYK